MRGDPLTPQLQTYLTTLGHAFLLGTDCVNGSTPEDIADALQFSWYDNWYAVGTMAGMTRAQTVFAVLALVEEDYILLSREGTAVYMRAKGAHWYVNQVWSNPETAACALSHPLLLLRGNRLLGTLDLLHGDQPLWICRFTAAPAFDAVRGLFAEEQRLTEEPGNEDAVRSARARIRMLGLRLVAEKAGERRRFAISIAGERATLRLGTFTG
jgi:hypothetical protein